MSFTVKEIFFSLQGEGALTGSPAVFVRFAGCNRACDFCDVDWSSWGKSTEAIRYEDEQELLYAVERLWPRPITGAGQKRVVLTGGEPALQVTGKLVRKFKHAGFQISMETNGTRKLHDDVVEQIDWLCVSPKTGLSGLRQDRGDELKVVYPQKGIDMADYEKLHFTRFSLQPMDPGGSNDSRVAFLTRTLDSTRECLIMCTERPMWNLSLQTHKLLGIR
jgi:7-carboxy-7-deazaguanine synthase